jgi:hypothetical protein
LPRSRTGSSGHPTVRAPVPLARAVTLICIVRTLLPDPPSVEFQELLERRRRWGADTHDEVWDGVYRMNPAPSGRHVVIQQQLAVILDGPARARELIPTVGEFNLGEPANYRVPDGGLHRDWRDRLFYPTAALVVEIVSPSR